jgi:DNA-binding Lrp family transcriptional regulator
MSAAELVTLDRSGRDLAAWAREARRLVTDGIRQAEIARATGVSAATVAQRLRRLAPEPAR